MKYIFEWYKDFSLGMHDGNIISEEEHEFNTDEEARQYAIDNGADYVWNVPEDRNPNTVYSRKV